MAKTLYKGFTLIDGTGANPVENAYFVIENQKVTKVGKDADEHIVEGCEVVDLSGKTVMPGLINAHNHITMNPDPATKVLSDAEATINGTINLKKQLDAGTTFLRDVGAQGYVDIELRKAVDSGVLEGAEFICAGKNICMTGGHGWSMGREADGADEARKAAREQLRAGADLIKLMATGGVMTPGVEPGSPQLNYEEMKAAIEEAHNVGKKTATHAQGSVGILNAVKAGIDSVEHGIFLTDEIIDLMAKQGTYLVPTLAAVYFIVSNAEGGNMPDYVVRKAKYCYDAHNESFRKAMKAGVKIAMGTDSGTPFNEHGSAPYEVKLMIAQGMPAMEALVTATKNSADLLGIQDNYGTLGEGKFADFLVLDENPLDNIETLFDLNSVYKKGNKVVRKYV